MFATLRVRFGAVLLTLFLFLPALSARPYPFVMVLEPEMAKYFVSLGKPPEVPYEMRRNAWSGRGVFRVVLAENGKVTEVSLIKTTGHKVVDETLMTSIRRWRGKPGKKLEIDFPILLVAPPRGMPQGGL